jgi:cytochrome c
VIRALVAMLVAVGAAAAVAPALRADAARGERVFQRCYACHSLKPDEGKLPGPSLHGVMGRRAGTLKAFEFSPAMAAAGRGGLVWTRESLDRFLADPAAVVPETAMAMPPLRDPEQRQDVIDYIEQAGRAL